MQYKIFHTEAKDSIDGKEHFSVLKKVKPIASFISESWDRAIDTSFDTHEEAEAALKDLSKSFRR